MTRWFTTRARPAAIAVALFSFLVSSCGGGGDVPAPLPAQPSQPVSPNNSPPSADAGLSQTVGFGSVVRLDGSRSRDANNDVLKYSWSFTSRPPASAAVLMDADTANATFLADAAGEFVAALIVSDATTSSLPVSVTIAVLPRPTPPVITRQPGASAIVAPSTATFSVEASGTAPLLYQWQVSTDGGTTYTDISSATALDYTTLETLGIDDGTLYRVKIVNAIGQTLSSPARLSVTQNQQQAFCLDNNRKGWCWGNAFPQGNGLGAVDVRGSNAIAFGSGAYFSRDSGLTWAPALVEEQVGLTRGAYADADTALAVGSGRIMKSTDGGATWKQVYRDDTVAFSNIVFPSAKTGFAFGNPQYSLNGVILRSDDAGSTWKRVAAAEMTLDSVTFADAATGLAVGSTGTYVGKMIRTADGGNSWTEVKSPNNVGRYFAATFLTPTVVLVAGDRGLLHSTDGGFTWNLLSNVSLYALTRFTDDVVIGITPNRQIVRSEDRGRNWQVVQQPAGYKIVYRVAVQNTRVGLAVGGSGMVLRSTDAGKSWLELHPRSHRDLAAIAWADTQIAVAVGQGTILRTSDAGRSWKQVHDAISNSLGSIAFANPSIAVAAGSPSMRTTDGGKTWSALSIRGQAVGFHGSVGLLVNNYDADNSVMGTVDAGLNWFPLRILERMEREELSGVLLLSPSVAYVTAGSYLTGSGGLFKTVDGGATWVEIRLPISQFFGITATPSGILYLWSGIYVFQSIDGGANWAIIFDVRSLPDIKTRLTSISCASDSICIATAVADGQFGRAAILRTVDAGATWGVIADAGRDGPSAPTASAFASPEIGAVVGRGGQVLRTENGGAR